VRKFLVVLALSLSTTAVAYANPASPPQPNGGSAPGWQLAIDNWLDQRGEQFEDWWYTTWGPMRAVAGSLPRRNSTLPG
jgi:hypothetical protein